MAVLIDMKMPESCYIGCPCIGLHWCNLLEKDTTEVLMEHRRLDACPLIEVPSRRTSPEMDKLLEEAGFE